MRQPKTCPACRKRLALRSQGAKHPKCVDAEEAFSRLLRRPSGHHGARRAIAVARAKEA